MRLRRIGGMAALVVALGLGLALSLGLWSSWTAGAAPTVRWVNAAPNPATEPADCTTAPYPDIATALAAAAADDIIRLCEGTYPGGATINKKVTVEGRAEATRADVKIEVAAAGTNGLIVAADGVTIRHLTLDGPTSNDNGIQLNPGTDDATISDVEATDWDYGIYVDDSIGTVVEDCSLHDNAEDGVLLGGGKRNTVRDNEIKKNGDDGVYVDDADEALVEGNTISGNTNEQIEVYDKSHVRIHRNQIDTTSGDGIWIGGVPAVPAEAFVQIGGSPENANTFTGPFAGADYYIELDCDAENTVDATYNFWGAGLQATDIAARIFNDEDDVGGATGECTAPDDVNGAVVFHPWATEPAPTATPSPTPTATGTPTPTPGNTRTIDLSPQGWHSLAWSGADATAPEDALNCIAGQFNIAYMYVGTTGEWLRFVPGNDLLSNIETVDKYDSLFVLINVAGAECIMSVE
jgi:parallel beta-helix repeat protein